MCLNVHVHARQCKCGCLCLRSNVTLIVKYHTDKKLFGVVNGCTHAGEMDCEMH